MKPGDSIPDGEDVVRYVGFSLVNDYGIDGTAFELSEADMRCPEPGLSCNWLGYFANIPKPIPRWDVHFGEIDDDRKDSTAPHITFRPQLGGHR